MITRRALLLGAATLSCRGAFGLDASSPFIFGAIRWDAQYCDEKGEPCYDEEKSLSDPRWQYRAPIHSILTAENKIKFAATQATFDAEIEVAAANGLSYWAYLAYGDDQKATIDFSHSMMKGLQFHLNSKKAHMVKFALIVSTHQLGKAGDFEVATKLIASFCANSNYQTCLGGRPVIFIYYEESDVEKFWKGDLQNLAQAIQTLRKECKSIGNMDPYLIVMSAPPHSAENVRSVIKADGITVYAVPVPKLIDIPYKAFDRIVENYWQDEAANTQAHVVPTCMVGWDAGPRKQNPPSWELKQPDARVLQRSVHAPTPEEFYDECKSAIKFIVDNPRKCPALLALIYAWNEDTEAGPLQPSIGDPTASLLKAMSKALR